MPCSGLTNLIHIHQQATSVISAHGVCETLLRSVFDQCRNRNLHLLALFPQLIELMGKFVDAWVAVWVDRLLELVGE